MPNKRHSGRSERHSEPSEESSLRRSAGKILRCAQNDEAKEKMPKHDAIAGAKQTNGLRQARSG